MWHWDHTFLLWSKKAASNMQKNVLSLSVEICVQKCTEEETFGCLHQELLLEQVTNDPGGAFQVLPCPRSHLLSPRHSLSSAAIPLTGPTYSMRSFASPSFSSCSPQPLTWLFRVNRPLKVSPTFFSQALCFVWRPHMDDWKLTLFYRDFSGPKKGKEILSVCLIHVCALQWYVSQSRVS